MIFVTLITDNDLVKTITVNHAMTVLGTSNIAHMTLTDGVVMHCRDMPRLSDLPNKIALLRLDTDWYESTLKELQVLWPKLVEGGYMVLDVLFFVICGMRRTFQ